jgi:hypothetical protein
MWWSGVVADVVADVAIHRRLVAVVEAAFNAFVA